MRLVVEAHERTDLGGEGIRRADDLVNHLHAVHRVDRPYLRSATIEELDLRHDDDHDDLRRGCG